MSSQKLQTMEELTEPTETTSTAFPGKANNIIHQVTYKKRVEDDKQLLIDCVDEVR